MEGKINLDGIRRNQSHVCGYLHKGVTNAVLPEIVNPAVLSTRVLFLDLRHDVPERLSPESGGYPTTTMRLSLHFRRLGKMLMIHV